MPHLLSSYIYIYMEIYICICDMYIHVCMWYVYVCDMHMWYIYISMFYLLYSIISWTCFFLFFYHDHSKFKVSISLLQQALYWSPSNYSCHSSSSQPILYTVAKMILSLTHLKNQWFPIVLSIKSKLLNMANKAVLGLVQNPYLWLHPEFHFSCSPCLPLVSPFFVPLATGSLNVTFLSA